MDMSQDEKLIVEERLAKPSAITPTLFVGIGGCGSKLICRVARHLRRRHDYREVYKDLNKFVIIDTNINDLELNREIVDDGLLISNFEKAEYTNLASGRSFLEPDSYFTQWVPHDYRFRAGDTAGAGQIRIESRLGSYYQIKHSDFVMRFRAILDELKAHEHGYRRLDTAEIRIVLCYSIAGGTGSGVHLPLAYLLRDLAKEVGKPSLLGVAILPSVFDEKVRANLDGTNANGYAALKETEHLMKLGSPESRYYQADGLVLHYNPGDDSKRRVYDKPFEFLYLIDRPERFSVDNVVDAAADGLYLQLFSPIFGEQAGDYDNYTQHQRFLVPHDFEAKGIQGFTTFYGTFGAAVLHVPTDGLIEYCARASALSLLRQSFLRDIPSGSLYDRLRIDDGGTFFQVRPNEREKEVPELEEHEFYQRTSMERDRLDNELFEKRVRLLAYCELVGRREGMFSEIFRHGHRLGVTPSKDGSVVFSETEYEELDQVRRDREMMQFETHRSGFSICEHILDNLTAAEPGGQPRILDEVARQLKRSADRIGVRSEGKGLLNKKVSYATLWQDVKNGIGQLVGSGTSLLDSGVNEIEGFDSMLNLEFLTKGAKKVNLLAKRYAVLRILKAIQVPISDPPKPKFGKAPEDRQIDADEAQQDEELRRLRSSAVDDAMVEIRMHFDTQLKSLVKMLNQFVDNQRAMQGDFPRFEKMESERLQRLRDAGSEMASRYVLDSEAYQTENGRRLWDFYYWHNWSNLLELGDERVQELITMSTVDSSGSGISTPLNNLYLELIKYSESELSEKIDGKPTAKEEADRNGLTLFQALEQEVLYRALYNSNRDELEKHGEQAIRRVLARYDAQSKDTDNLFDQSVHQDYLRDKIKRVVAEKASLLNYYDESRDQHGGVRPDHVAIAVIDESLRNTILGEILEGAARELSWVTQKNPKEIVFYRSVLNVPLYVFPRMDTMKEHYYAFKTMAKRSKVLHIDRNWENTLSDLDPDDAVARHRRELMRAEIVNFAALWTTEDPRDPKNPHYLYRREGNYRLRDPLPRMEKDDDGNERIKLVNGLPDYGSSLLGGSLSEAIASLPEVLEAQPIKHGIYQNFLNGVRLGLAPRVLLKVVALPFSWRSNRDELRTNYGPNPEPEQVLRLQDFTAAYEGLRDAIEAMLSRLRERQKERETLQDDFDMGGLGLDDAQITLNLADSIKILSDFSRDWQAMLDPTIGQKPRGFEDLFRPISEEELKKELDKVRGS
jgi:hypothetical protein